MDGSRAQESTSATNLPIGVVEHDAKHDPNFLRRLEHDLRQNAELWDYLVGEAKRMSGDDLVLRQEVLRALCKLVAMFKRLEDNHNLQRLFAQPAPPDFVENQLPANEAEPSQASDGGDV